MSSMKSPPSPARRPHPGLGIVLAGVLACSVASAEHPRSHLEPAGGVASGPPTSASLGLTLDRASAVLRQQLAIRRGAGLVVENVTAGSRAARAGFAQHDVLVKLDDQLLLLPEQLDALLESAEPDAPLDCTVLRGGHEVVIPIAHGAQVAARPQRQPAANGGLRPTASSLAIVQESMPKQGPIDASRLRRLADETLVRQDADFQIRLTSGAETRLVVSDTEGRVVFNDAIDTPEGRSRMPVSVRDRVTDMEKMLDGRPDHTSAATVKPTAEIGRLDVAPVELR
jgi:hypothetical protein